MERHWATVTMVRLVSHVDSHVQINTDSMFEATTADCTHMRFLVEMGALVETASAVLCEMLVAPSNTTRDVTLSSVDLHVRFHRRLRLELTSTVTAYTQFLLFPGSGQLFVGCRYTMTGHVPFQCRHILERHPAYGAVDRAVQFVTIQMANYQLSRVLFTG